jgi:hypothetical protein
MTQPRARILTSGASGFIGVNLVRALAAKRIQTFQLIRKKEAKPGMEFADAPGQSGPGSEAEPQKLLWDPSAVRPISDLQPLEGLAAAIHLSGANIFTQRWTESYKHKIVDSRVTTTLALVRAFSQLKEPPRTLLCASAIGINGDRGDEALTEESPAGQGFLADTCIAWESAADTAKALGMRVVHLRFGVVLAPNGGALQQMLPLFRLGLGGRLGSGRQWMSWIALPDLIEAVLHLADVGEERGSGAAGSRAYGSTAEMEGAGTIEGPVNIVSPQPVRNIDFTTALGRAIHRPAILPAPAFALRLAFGERADAALLASVRVLPQRLLDSGFSFRYPDLASAFQALL